MTCDPLNTVPLAPGSVRLPVCESPCSYLTEVQAPSNFLDCSKTSCSEAENLTGAGQRAEDIGLEQVGAARRALAEPIPLAAASTGA